MQFESLRPRIIFFLLAALFFAISSGAVVAAEWSIEPSISLREEYNENIRFTESPHPGVWQSRLSPKLNLSSKTEVSEVSGSAQLNINQYAGDPQVEDRNDKFVKLFSRIASERNTWGMNLSYAQDSTAESERIATGVVQIRTQRSLRSLNPSWTRTLTERASLKLDYNFQDVKYEEHINLNDYASQQAGASLQYQLTERDQVSLSANYSIVDYSEFTNLYPAFINVVFPSFGVVQFPGGGTDTIGNKSTTQSIQASVSHLFSETLRGNLSVGRRSIGTDITHHCNGELGTTFPTTNIISCSGSDRDPLVTFNSQTTGNGYSFSTSLEKTFAAAKVSGFASREANPSGSGLVETDKIGVSLNKRLMEALTASFDAVSYRTRFINVINPGSSYYTVEPKMSWRFTELWTLDTGYRYARYQPDSAANNATTSNAVYLNLTYNWLKMAVSR